MAKTNKPQNRQSPPQQPSFKEQIAGVAIENENLPEMRAAFRQYDLIIEEAIKALAGEDIKAAKYQLSVLKFGLNNYQDDYDKHARSVSENSLDVKDHPDSLDAEKLIGDLRVKTEKLEADIRQFKINQGKREEAETLAVAEEIRRKTNARNEKDSREKLGNKFDGLITKHHETIDRLWNLPFRTDEELFTLSGELDLFDSDFADYIKAWNDEVKTKIVTWDELDMPWRNLVQRHVKLRDRNRDEISKIRRDIWAINQEKREKRAQAERKERDRQAQAERMALEILRNKFDGLITKHHETIDRLWNLPFRTDEEIFTLSSELDLFDSEFSNYIKAWDDEVKTKTVTWDKLDIPWDNLVKRHVKLRDRNRDEISKIRRDIWAINQEKREKRAQAEGKEREKQAQAKRMALEILRNKFSGLIRQHNQTIDRLMSLPSRTGEECVKLNSELDLFEHEFTNYIKVWDSEIKEKLATRVDVPSILLGLIGDQGKLRDREKKEVGGLRGELKARRNRQKTRESRESREALRQPWLDELRAEGREKYYKLIDGNFWDHTISLETKEMVLANANSWNDEKLNNYVKDIPAFKTLYQELLRLRTEARSIEDSLMRNEPIVIKVDAIKMRAVLDTFGRCTRILKQTKNRADREYAYERRNIAGGAVQFLLDENPEVVGELKGKIPHGFGFKQPKLEKSIEPSIETRIVAVAELPDVEAPSYSPMSGGEYEPEPEAPEPEAPEPEAPEPEAPEPEAPKPEALNKVSNESRVSLLARRLTSAVDRMFGSSVGSEETGESVLKKRHPKEAEIAEIIKSLLVIRNDQSSRQQAHLDVIQRLERVIKSLAKLAEEKDRMLEALKIIEVDYTTQSRAQNDDAEQEIKTLINQEAGSNRTSDQSAVRFLALRNGKQLKDKVENFEQRIILEAIALANADSPSLRHAAESFRQSWVANNESLMNIADALLALGEEEKSITTLEKSLPGLRSALEVTSEDEDMSDVVEALKQARLAVQSRIDDLLPGLERSTNRPS